MAEGPARPAVQEQVSLIRAISEDFSNRSADETLLGEIMPSCTVSIMPPNG